MESNINMIENKYRKVDQLIKERSKVVANAGRTTGYKGVSVDKRLIKPRFQSKFLITQNKKEIKINLGSYDTAEEAYIARLKFIDSLK